MGKFKESFKHQVAEAKREEKLSLVEQMAVIKAKQAAKIAGEVYVATGVNALVEGADVVKPKKSRKKVG